MAKKFVHSLTLANGRVTGAAFSFIASADLPAGAVKTVLQGMGASANPEFTTTPTVVSITTSSTNGVPGFVVLNTALVNVVQLAPSSKGHGVVGVSNSSGVTTISLSGQTSTISAFSGTGAISSLNGTNGSVSLAGVTSGLVIIATQAVAGSYSFNLPTTAGASGQVLTSGAGSAPMTWSAAPPVTLFDHYASVGNIGADEDVLYSDTLTAGRLANNGEKIEAEYGGSFVSSGTATRQVKLHFGGTAIFDTGALTLSLSSAWTMYATIIRVSTSVVRYMVSLTTQGAALAAYTAVGELTGLTLTNTQILKLTGEAAGVGAATDDIVAKIGTVLWRPAA